MQSLVHSVSVDSDLYTQRDCPPELRSIHTDSPPELRSIHLDDLSNTQRDSSSRLKYIYTQRDSPSRLRSMHHRETVHLDSDIYTQTDSPSRLRPMHHRNSLSPHIEKVDAVFKILLSLFHTDSRSCNQRKLRYQLDHAGISSDREGGCCFKLLFVVSSTQIHVHVISINSNGPSSSTGREGRSIRRFKMLFGLLIAVHVIDINSDTSSSKQFVSSERSPALLQRAIRRPRHRLPFVKPAYTHTNHHPGNSLSL